MSQILVIDDEASISWGFREFLSEEGHEVHVAASAEEGLKLAECYHPDVVVLDVRLPGMDGLTAMEQLKTHVGLAPIIVITAFGSLDTAVRALEAGAFDYLTKPFDLSQAATVVQRALDASAPLAASGDVRTEVIASETLIGSSPPMQGVFKRIALVAPTDAAVLITGESGTGKELVARAIHRHSARGAGPFLPVSLPALSPTLVESELFGHVRGAFTGATMERAGLLELADGGTVLLDEIADAAPSLQVKLLRAIEHHEISLVGEARTRPINVRLVASTNQPLAQLIASGRFREDLYFRLSVFHIHLPPLRERADDIPALAQHFLRQSDHRAADRVLSADMLDTLRTRSWPGNVRELRNAIEHAAILARGGPARPEHLPPPAESVAWAGTGRSEKTRATHLRETAVAWTERKLAELAPEATDTDLYARFLAETEPALLHSVLQHCHNNRAATARLLGIHRATLRQKLRQHRLDAE